MGGFAGGGRRLDASHAVLAARAGSAESTGARRTEHPHGVRDPALLPARRTPKLDARPRPLQRQRRPQFLSGAGHAALAACLAVLIFSARRFDVVMSKRSDAKTARFAGAIPPSASGFQTWPAASNRRPVRAPARSRRAPSAVRGAAIAAGPRPPRPLRGPPLRPTRPQGCARSPAG